MDKPWVVYVNGLFWDDKLTEVGANRLAEKLREVGKQRVSVAYRIVKELI